MYDFLVLWDSSLTEQDERLIEVALKEAIEVFPGCTFLAIRPDSEEIPISVANSVILRAAVEKNTISASDIARIVEDIRRDVLDIPDEVHVFFITAIDVAKTESAHTSDTSTNVVVQTLSSYEDLTLEDKMYCFLHSFCHEIGCSLGLLSMRCCDDERCTMHIAKNTEELLKQARLEEHGELRLCQKCQKTLCRVVPLVFCEPSDYEII